MCEKDFDEQALEEEFNDAKKAYISARKEQKDKIKEKFEDIKKSGNDSFGFIVKDVDDYHYTDNNWFGIDVTIEKNGKKKKYHIALQAYDRDENKESNNIHVLMDRLGIYEYDRCDNSDLSFDKIEGKMINTNIDLPMYKYDLLFAAIKQYEKIKTYEDCNKDFNDKRNNYIKVRRKQQAFIAKTLEDLKNEEKSQFEVITPSKNENGYYNHTSGAGRPKYNNHKSIKEFNNSIWKWIEVVVALLIAYAMYYMPILILKFQRKMRAMEMEDEVMQFQTIILMLMYIERISVEYIIEWLARYANIFKDPLMKCLNNYESGAIEALEELKEDAPYKPFVRIVESLQSAVENVKLTDAFDELETERTFYQEVRKETNERLIAKKAKIGQVIGFAPMVTLFVGYLIVPLIWSSVVDMGVYFSQMGSML